MRREVGHCCLKLSPTTSPNQSPADEGEHPADVREEECCRLDRQKAADLSLEKEVLETRLREKEAKMKTREKEFVAKLTRIENYHAASLGEMRGLLESQQKIGGRWDYNYYQGPKPGLNPVVYWDSDDAGFHG